MRQCPMNGADIIGTIYEAAFQPELWVEVMARIAEDIGATVGSFGGTDAKLGTARFTISLGFGDEMLFANYRARHIKNPFTIAAQEIPPGKAFLMRQIIDPQALYRSDLYQGMLRPMNAFYCIGTNVMMSSEMFAFVAWYRAEREADFEEGTLERCQRFVPHLSKATELFVRFRDIEMLRSAALESLDRMESPLLLLGSNADVLFCNEAARTLISDGDGVAVRKSRLHALDAREDRALSRLVSDTCRTGASDGDVPGGALGITRPSGLRPLSLVVAPLRGHALSLGGETPAAAVFIGDPEKHEDSPLELIQKVFTLSGAEASLARALATGEGLASAADRLGVAKNTAKAQLRSIFRKTGARRQSDLIRRLQAVSPSILEPVTMPVMTDPPPPNPGGHIVTVGHRSGFVWP